MSQGSTKRVRPSATAGRRVRVRMYRQGLGDAFLVTLDPDSRQPAHILIDLGSIGTGSGVPMDEVVADVLATTGGKLRAVVATHEHQDHVSGFPAAQAAGLNAEEAWLAWTEDARDADAQKLEKYRGDLFTATARAAIALRERKQVELAARVDEVLGFHAHGGAPAAAGGLKRRSQEGMNAARALATSGRVRYLEPGDIVEPAWAEGVRVFVLGPPRAPAALRHLGEHGSPDLYELAASAGVTVDGAPPLVTPFDPWLRRDTLPGPLGESYAAEAWRSLDDTGADSCAELALQLDNLTNNTSLVLAIELDGDRVLLFAADAQLGSWRTWPDVDFTVEDHGSRRKLKGRELLERTVFYKVGHHASHNATATRLGLELMGGPELTAFIPLDEKVAQAKRWPMPASKLWDALQRKTRGRTYRSDNAVGGGNVAVTPAFVDYQLWPHGAEARPRRLVAARTRRR